MLYTSFSLIWSWLAPTHLLTFCLSPYHKTSSNQRGWKRTHASLKKGVKCIFLCCNAGPQHNRNRLCTIFHIHDELKDRLVLNVTTGRATFCSVRAFRLLRLLLDKHSKKIMEKLISEKQKGVIHLERLLEFSPCCWSEMKAFHVLIFKTLTKLSVISDSCVDWLVFHFHWREIEKIILVYFGVEIWSTYMKRIKVGRFEYSPANSQGKKKKKKKSECPRLFLLSGSSRFFSFWNNPRWTRSLKRLCFIQVKITNTKDTVHGCANFLPEVENMVCTGWSDIQLKLRTLVEPISALKVKAFCLSALTKAILYLLIHIKEEGVSAIRSAFYYMKERKRHMKRDQEGVLVHV